MLLAASVRKQRLDPLHVQPDVPRHGTSCRRPCTGRTSLRQPTGLGRRLMQISVTSSSRTSSLVIPETARIIRGISTVLTASLMITFRNQSRRGGIRRQRQSRVPQHHLREVQQVDVSARGLLWRP